MVCCWWVRIATTMWRQPSCWRQWCRDGVISPVCIIYGWTTCRPRAWSPWSRTCCASIRPPLRPWPGSLRRTRRAMRTRWSSC